MLHIGCKKKKIEVIHKMLPPLPSSMQLSFLKPGIMVFYGAHVPQTTTKPRVAFAIDGIRVLCEIRERYSVVQHRKGEGVIAWSLPEG